MMTNREDLASLLLFLCLFLFYVLIATNPFSEGSITVDPYSHNVYAVESSVGVT